MLWIDREYERGVMTLELMESCETLDDWRNLLFSEVPDDPLEELEDEAESFVDCQEPLAMIPLRNWSGISFRGVTFSYKTLWNAVASEKLRASKISGQWFTCRDWVETWIEAPATVQKRKKVAYVPRVRGRKPKAYCP